jgi:hypothetical protein
VAHADPGKGRRHDPRVSGAAAGQLADGVIYLVETTPLAGCGKLPTTDQEHRSAGR